MRVTVLHLCKSSHRIKINITRGGFYISLSPKSRFFLFKKLGCFVYIQRETRDNGTNPILPLGWSFIQKRSCKKLQHERIERRIN